MNWLPLTSQKGAFHAHQGLDLHDPRVHPHFTDKGTEGQRKDMARPESSAARISSNSVLALAGALLLPLCILPLPFQPGRDRRSNSQLYCGRSQQGDSFPVALVIAVRLHSQTWISGLSTSSSERNHQSCLCVTRMAPPEPLPVPPSDRTCLGRRICSRLLCHSGPHLCQLSNLWLHFFLH